MKILMPLVAFLSVGFLAVSSLFFPRDGILTTGIESFEPSEIVKYRMWEEHPVQLLRTFFPPESTRFYGLGNDDETSRALADRIGLVFGDQYVDRDASFEDIFSRSDAEDLKASEAFFAEFAYFTSLPCPHDSQLKCDVGLGWNRDFTKQQDVSIYFARATEDMYVFVDRSLLEGD